MPLILTPRRQRQTDVCEFEASLVYISSSRTARATQRNPVWKTEGERVRGERRQRERGREREKKDITLRLRESLHF